MAAFTLPHFSNYTMVIWDFNNELSQTNFVTYSEFLNQTLLFHFDMILSKTLLQFAPLSIHIYEF